MDKKLFLDEDISTIKLPEPSCSKHNGVPFTSETNTFEEDICKIEPLQNNEVALWESDELNTRSSYQIYDDNNNFLLTNLNEGRILSRHDNDILDNKYHENQDNLFNLNVIKNTCTPKECKLDISTDYNTKKEFSKPNNNATTTMPNNIVNLNYDYHTSVEIYEDANNVHSNNKEKFDSNFVNFEQYIKCNLISKQEDNLNNETINANTNSITLDSSIENSQDTYLKNDVINEFNTKNIVNNGESDSDKCSYHSSDFEFINESEAKMKCGIFQNMELKSEIDEEYQTLLIKDYFKMPIPKSSSNNVPDEVELCNFFDRPVVPYPTRNMENKSVCPTRRSHLEYQGIGFDMTMRVDQNEASDELKEDANESRKIILSMYPQENRRVRRFRRPR